MFEKAFEEDSGAFYVYFLPYIMRSRVCVTVRVQEYSTVSIRYCSALYHNLPAFHGHIAGISGL